MNSKVFLIVRILLALLLIVFGLNKFLNFLPQPSNMSDEAQIFFGALFTSKIMILVAVIEIATGIALLLNKYGALMAIILMSVSVNAVLYHAVLDIGNIPPALALLVLNGLVLFGYKEKYKSLFV